MVTFSLSPGSRTSAEAGGTEQNGQELSCCKTYPLRNVIAPASLDLARAAEVGKGPRSRLLFLYNFRKRRRCLFAYEGYTAILNEGSEPLVLAQLQPFAARGVSGQQKCSWKSAGATQLERSEILEPVAIGHVGILGFPLGQFEQIFLGNPPFLCAIAQMGPLLSGQPLPLNLGHGFSGQVSVRGIRRPLDPA